MVADLRTALQETWTKALTAASSAEEQAQALVGRVGSLLEGATQKELLAEVTSRIQTQRQELHGHVQQAVKSALDRLRLPSSAELTVLRTRLGELESRLAAMEAEREAHKAGLGGRPGA